MVPNTILLGKSDILFPPMSKLGRKSGEEMDGILPVSQVLINPWRNASEASAG
jgi:hypothetical protein